MILTGSSDKKTTRGDRSLVVLSRNPYLYSVRRFVEAAELAGYRTSIIDPYMIAVEVGSTRHDNRDSHTNLKGDNENRTPENDKGFAGSCVYKGSGRFSADIVINRLSSLACEYSVQVLAGFERSGALTINMADPTAAYRHKFSALSALEVAGLPVPETRLIRSGQDINIAVTELGGPPVILKFARGSQGLGVIWAESFDAISSITESLNLIQYDVMIQRYYPSARELDLRVIVLGGKPITAVRRVAGDDDFRSNFHRGGSLHRYELNDELADLAARAANALGLSFAGVDIILGDGESNYNGTLPGRPLVLEVNLSPGFEGLDNVYGCDIAREVVKWAGGELASMCK